MQQQIVVEMNKIHPTQKVIVCHTGEKNARTVEVLLVKDGQNFPRPTDVTFYYDIVINDVICVAKKQATASSNANGVIISLNGITQAGRGKIELYAKNGTTSTLYAINQIEIYSVGELINGKVLTTVSQGDLKDFFENFSIADGSVTTDKIANNTISTDKLQNQAVTNGKIANGAVSSTKLEDNSVRFSKLNNQDTVEELGGLTVQQALADVKNKADKNHTHENANNTITTDKLQNQAVTNDKIANGAVTNDKIANNTISTDKLQNQAVTNDKIANGAVSSTKLEDNSVRFSKLNNQDTVAELGGLTVRDALIAGTKTDTLKSVSFKGSATLKYCSPAPVQSWEFFGKTSWTTNSVKVTNYEDKTAYYKNIEVSSSGWNYSNLAGSDWLLSNSFNVNSGISQIHFAGENAKIIITSAPRAEYTGTGNQFVPDTNILKVVSGTTSTQIIDLPDGAKYIYLSVQKDVDLSNINLYFIGTNPLYTQRLKTSPRFTAYQVNTKTYRFPNLVAANEFMQGDVLKLSNGMAEITHNWREFTNISYSQKEFSGQFVKLHLSGTLGELLANETNASVETNYFSLPRVVSGEFYLLGNVLYLSNYFADKLDKWLATLKMWVKTEPVVEFAELSPFPTLTNGENFVFGGVNDRDCQISYYIDLDTAKADVDHTHHTHYTSVQITYAHYTESSWNHYMKYKYSTSNGFCTLMAKAKIINGWQNIYYRLPLNAVHKASCVAMDSNDQAIHVQIASDSGYQVLRLRRLDGQNMSEGYLHFTITYCYQNSLFIDGV